MKQFSRRSVRRRNSSGSLAAADSAPAQVVFFSQDQQFSEASTDPYRFPNSQATSLQTEAAPVFYSEPPESSTSAISLSQHKAIGSSRSPPKRSRAAAGSGSSLHAVTAAGLSRSSTAPPVATTVVPSRFAVAAGGNGIRSRQQQPIAQVLQAEGSGTCAVRTGSCSSKRYKQGSPTVDQPPDSKGGLSSKQQQQNPAGPVSLPTPRRRKALLPESIFAGQAEARPAQTVMEAQERGELVQIRDDARYAMDGLVATCSIDTQRDSAVALADMLCSRKGRLALRADGLAQQLLSSLAKLKAGKDPVLALASTIVLFMLTLEDAHPAYLASIAAAVLVDQLLQNDHSFEVVSIAFASGAKLHRMLKQRPLSGLLASANVSSHRPLLLVALEQATSSQQTSKAAAVERLKHNLQQYGGLSRLGKLVAEAAGDAVSASHQVHLLLLVLENATFTCQENGRALVQLQVSAAAKGQLTTAELQPFPAVLVQVTEQLLTDIDSTDSRQALHVCLSVLMNLSHQNPEGGAIISKAGGLGVAADTINRLLGPVQQCHQALCQQVLQHLELVSVALGLLINLVSGEPAHSRQLAGAPAAAACQEAEHEGLIPLLCNVMSAIGQLLEDAHERQHDSDEYDATGSPTVGATADSYSRAMCNGSQHEVNRSEGGNGGLSSNSAGEASIIQVYCGMLLGFLVRDCADLAVTVPQLLDGGSMEPVLGAVERCLAFYVSTGAITDHTRQTLEELLQHLNSLSASTAS